ncbi:MAG: bacterial Ig-like domain-containing protein [Treponema sp.]|nr:bacterial Ig-like domain-containing protein [Treponema sp.]
MINRLQKNIRHITNLFVLCLLSFILVCSCKIETSSPPVITGIKITSLPEKTVYYVGERIDYTGLKVTATYSDGSEKEIMDYTISLEAGTTLTKEGKHTVEIKYNGFSQTFSIEVLPVITEIKISSLPEKTVYYVSESIDYTGLQVISVYSDGHEEEITDYTLSLEEGTVLAKEQTLTVNIQFNGFSTAFDIEIRPNQVSVVQVTLPEHSDVEGLLSYDETKKTFTAKNGFASYTWWLDSEKLSNQTSSYTLNIANLSSGYHSLMIVVKTSDYERYSATATINIMREER